MGYLERNSETLKTPGFSGFDSRVSGFSRVVIFGFGSGSGSKKVGLFARVSGFRVQIPITSPAFCLLATLRLIFWGPLGFSKISCDCESKLLLS